eukprot:5385882-Amphidinium_carterae.1
MVQHESLGPPRGSDCGIVEICAVEETFQTYFEFHIFRTIFLMPWNARGCGLDAVVEIFVVFTSL